jgi:hypothetical protein
MYAGMPPAESCPAGSLSKRRANDQEKARRLGQARRDGRLPLEGGSHQYGPPTRFFLHSALISDGEIGILK